jgi:hypothetical protein
MLVFLVIGLAVFAILFRLAGLQGLLDPDAMRWMLKAKILYLYNGGDIVRWFSNPGFAFAHLDYPTLVPSLHSATYDSLGHVDEFVTKFWPTWMLFFLIAGLVPVNGAGRSKWLAPLSGLLAFLLLPGIQQYVQWEGSTMPMIFFVVLGFVQSSIGLAQKDQARLGLGLTLLFGAAMTTYQGFIILAVAGGWVVLIPAVWPLFKPSSVIWRMTGFCLFAALPFIWLRARIPTVDYESHWTSYAAHSPGVMLSNWPGLALSQMARIFVNPDFAHWSAQGGKFHWAGNWEGLTSLYNHTTLGLAWFCVLLTIVLWFWSPSRRPIILWVFAVFVSVVVALSGVYASFVSIKGLDEVLGYTNEVAGGRYLLPVLAAWFAVALTLFCAKERPEDPSRA